METPTAIIADSRGRVAIAGLGSDSPLLSCRGNVRMEIRAGS